MKSEELFEALEDISPADVRKARSYDSHRKAAWSRSIALAACAAIILGAVFGIPLLRKQEPALQSMAFSNFNPLAPEVLSVMAVYPESLDVKQSTEEFMESDEYWSWRKEYGAQTFRTEGLQPGMAGYYSALLEKLLVSDGENTVCSPISTYIALAMLTEVTGGNTRQQILDMLGAADIETLRENVSALWKSNYADTPSLKSLLANSLWLDSSREYDQTTLKTLAEKYYASSFSGKPGSEEMNEALRSWTDESTGGLLTKYTKDLSVEPDSVLQLLSSIYFKAMWENRFMEQGTSEQLFHGANGDTKVEMMHMSDMMPVYRSASFTSVSLGLRDSGSMYFLLPNENTDINALVSDPDVMKAIGIISDDSLSYPMVHLSVPKFMVAGKVDLLDTIRALGAADALDPAKADFSLLTELPNKVYLSKAEHAALVEIDEQGVTGAAYTSLVMAEGAAIPEDEIDFVLDRPFMFIVTGRDGSILFAGIVRNIV